jgi:RNA polymerase sigma-70 factor (ECF subfamily)
VLYDACKANLVSISKDKLEMYRALVKDLKKQEPTAPDRLYQLFASKIDRRVWRMLGPDGEHQDLVQQTFSQIFSNIKHLKNPENLESWITSITINVIKKELKRRSYRKILLFKPYAGYTDEKESSTESVTDETILLKHAFTVLDKLPASYRIIFIMKYFDGNTNIEISQVFGYSLATVKRKVIKARELFKKNAMNDFFLAALITEEKYEQ